jgi:hypothetical protein
MFGRDHIVPGLFSEFFNVAASRPAQMTTEQAKCSHKRPYRQGKPGVNPTRGRPRTLKGVMFSLLSAFVLPNQCLAGQKP